MSTTREENMIYAVTGFMASGKNVFCKLLEQKGALSIDADKLVHKAIENSKEKIFESFESLAKAAHIEIRDQNNCVNRKMLGKLIFSSPELLKKQEEIVYPEITKMILDFIDNNKSSIILINATVLYKTPVLLDLCNEIFFVSAPKLIRLLRAKKRDSMSFRLILQRFNNQKNLLKEYKKTGKNINIINNWGSYKRLEQIVNKKIYKVLNI